jgi:REP element-mobilizing transposase RayT
MTLPRLVIPGSCILITRRCLERMMLLRPDEDVVALFAELLALASDRCKVSVLGVVLMSNHYHLVLHDREGRFPEFIAWFHARLTRRLNRLRGRSDTMWEARQTSVVELGDRDAILEALAYVHLNPVAAGLVADPLTWPGIVTGPADYAPGGTARGRMWPFQVEVPPSHAHMAPGAFQRLLAERIERRFKWLHEARRQAGQTYGTPEAALAVPWYSSPNRPLPRSSAEGPSGNPSLGSGDAGSDDAGFLLEAFRRRITDPGAEPWVGVALTQAAPEPAAPEPGDVPEAWTGGPSLSPRTGLTQEAPEPEDAPEASVGSPPGRSRQVSRIGSLHVKRESDPGAGAGTRKSAPESRPMEGPPETSVGDQHLEAASTATARGPVALEPGVGVEPRLEPWVGVEPAVALEPALEPGVGVGPTRPASSKPRGWTGAQRAARRTRRGQPPERPRINPSVKASSPKRRAELLARRREFRLAYAAALVALRAGLDVTFPGGTWSLHRNLNVPADAAPPPAWSLG